MRKFGIEIEFTGSPEAVVRELRNGGLPVIQQSSHLGHSPTHWVVKRDRSVRSGGELVSPPLDFDDPIQRGQVTLALLALQRAGAGPDRSAGIHVHVDASDLSHKQVAATARFFYKFQDVLYRLASSGWQSIRGYTYCKPLDERRAKAMYRVTDERSFSRAWYGSVAEIVRARHSNSDGTRYCGLNLHSWVFRGTIEFRIFNSSVNPERVQAYVAIAMGIVQDARNGFSRSIAKSFLLGGMATSGEPDKAAKSAFLRFQQVMTTDSTDTKRVVSKDDWKLIRKAWTDSRPQVR